MKCLPDVVQVT